MKITTDFLYNVVFFFFVVFAIFLAIPTFIKFLLRKLNDPGKSKVIKVILHKNGTMDIFKSDGSQTIGIHSHL